MANRYTNLINSFRTSFCDVKKIYLYRAPGRVNLIGEHTDYNGLPVLPMAINYDTVIVSSPRADNKVHIKNVNTKFEERQFEINFQIPPYPKGDWGNYCKAAFQTLQNYVAENPPKSPFDKGGFIKGMNALVYGNIPAGSGLSSSSALVVAFAVVINDFNQVNLDKLSLAELLAVGERYVGTQGGGMDQATSLSGRKGQILKIDFSPLRIEYIPFPGDYIIVVCNSLIEAKKSAEANLSYNQRVIECRLGTAILRKFLENKYKADCNIDLLGDIKKTQFSHLLKNIDNFLNQVFVKDVFELSEISKFLEISEQELREKYLKLKDGSFFQVTSGKYKIKKRVRHVFSEAERVEKSRENIKNKDMEKFGRLMYESHKSCAEDYEISCPELDQLVKIAYNNGALGSRLTGAGFGGCSVSLVHKKRVDEFIKKVTSDYYGNYLPENRISDYIFAAYPSEGAGKIDLQ
ncbi:MAG: galactokinase [Elusimicrobia bacterium CG_4_10_14_0_8_um_filter_37_32]|nr:MAG: galactokinase [Elusimicrobia bacterium CG02_land_8_20_14_3_00_37_13]PIZ13740.1 MAG: galactokinase [Elusimicrobia bacterium CG_4_10_14_0_8_um_filter_37_32]